MPTATQSTLPASQLLEGDHIELDGSPWTVTAVNVETEAVCIELDHVYGVAVERECPVRIIWRG
jgi:hypothetical protein